jgi:Holliday junction resolvase
MSTQPESRLSRAIIKALRLNGWFAFKVHGSALMQSGLPDIIVCAEGQFIGLETKMPGKEGNTSVVQELIHQRIRESGGRCFVISSVREAIDSVESALRSC